MMALLGMMGSHVATKLDTGDPLTSQPLGRGPILIDFMLQGQISI